MRTKTQSGHDVKKGHRVTGAAEWWAKQRQGLYRPKQIWVPVIGGFEPVHVVDVLADEEKPLRFVRGTRAPGSAVTKRKNEIGYGR
jgi:hypothetical protein